MPFGPCWRRYNHDGFGQRPDGGPYQGWEYGHAWPVLTGERGQYELAAGRDVQPFIRAMEGFATSTKLLPEQVWALPDQPKAHMAFARPTGGAMPLVWAHGEHALLHVTGFDLPLAELKRLRLKEACMDVCEPTSASSAEPPRELSEKGTGR